MGEITQNDITEYVRKHGVRCPDPECDGDDLVGGSVEINGNTATQEITCGDCNLTWTDHYTLSGVQIEGGDYFDAQPGEEAK